jgi:hypothetical protein
VRALATWTSNARDSVLTRGPSFTNPHPILIQSSANRMGLSSNHHTQYRPIITQLVSSAIADDFVVDTCPTAGPTVHAHPVLRVIAIVCVHSVDHFAVVCAWLCPIFHILPLFPQPRRTGCTRFQRLRLKVRLPPTYSLLLTLLTLYGL